MSFKKTILERYTPKVSFLLLWVLLIFGMSNIAYAAPAFQAAGTAATGTGTVSPAWPAHAIDDVALLFVESAGGEAATLSTPAGFVAVANSPQATGAGTAGTRITVFWARAASTTMAAPTVADPGDHVYAQIITYRGVINTGNPWDVTGGGVKAAASTAVTVTSITTNVPETLIVQAVARADDASGAEFSAETNANLVNITERSDAGTTSGNGGGFAVWDGVKALAGATGNTTATVTSSINAFLSIALVPVPFSCTPPTNTPGGLTLTCVCDTFGRASLNPSTIFAGNFSLSNSDGLGNPYINATTGLLRLTENTNNNAKAATVPGIFPAIGNYISVEFLHYAYRGGNPGADGIAVTLSDYSIPAVPGGFGGSLGYAQRTGIAGFAGGWVGVALDEYGNYQNPTEGRILGPGLRVQSVGVRGPGSGTNGYRYMGGTASNPGGLSVSANSATAIPAPGYMYQVIVDARNYGAGTVDVSVNRDATTKNGSTYTSLFGPFNAYTEANYALGQGWITKLVPDYWKLSFTGSTGGSVNVHEIGGLRVCAQTVLPPTGGTASGFSAIDEAYPGAPTVPAYPNFQTGNIYMKLAGTSFKLWVAALTSTGISTGYSAVSAKYLQVKLVDNTDNACGSDAARTCVAACTNKTGVEAGATQIATFASGSTTGVASPSPTFTLNSSYKNLIAVMKECTTSACTAFTATTPACSADSFSVRPLSITSVTSSNATNATTAGTPIFKAGGENFSLTATTTGVAGSPSGYTGVMKINNAVLQAAAPATVVGVLAGSFPAATSGTPSSTATGAAFTYSEVGGFILSGYNPATDTTSRRGVYDGVAVADECTTPGLTTAQCDALKAATWAGLDSISTKGDCVADSYSNVKVAGKYGCNFGQLANTAVIGRFVPDHFAVSGGALVNRSGLCPLGTGCPSTFTYIGEQMNAVFTLTAQAAGNSTTKNYVGNNSAGQLAKFNPAAAGNPLGLAVAYAAVSSAAAGAGVTTVPVDQTVGFVVGDALWIPGAGAAGVALNATVTSLTSNTITLNTPIVTAVPVNTNIERDLTGSLTFPSTATSSGFVAGVAANISAPLIVNRGSTNWYPTLNVGVAPVDGDGILASPYNLDAAYVSGNDHALVGSTDLRYGRIKILNVHGSELLQLPVTPVTAQYWSGLNYVTNTLDSTSSFVVSWSNCQKLSPTSTWPIICPPPTSVSPSPVVFVSGASSYILSKPGAGNTGSVNMTTSTLIYLPSNIARATFGVHKGANEFIYLRENY